MPGLIMCNRRWSLGSDDMVLPAIVMALLHAIWLVVLSVLLVTIKLEETEDCQSWFWEQIVGYVAIWAGSIVLELCIVYVALKGTVFDDKPRESMQYLLYIKIGVVAVELTWVAMGIAWLHRHYFGSHCTLSYSLRNVILGLVICNLVMLSLTLVIGWCGFDYAGGSWLKLKNFQHNSQLSSRSSSNKKLDRRSRNWRTRKVRRAYQSSWNNRCRFLFCCSSSSPDTKGKNSFADIARVLSEFFRDLDVVPTDVVVGLVLLRKRQQQTRQRLISQPTNNVYDFLSGVKVTPETKFVALNDPRELRQLRDVVHFMYFAFGAYGWPMFLRRRGAACKLFPNLRCCCLPCCVDKSEDGPVVVEDNCCGCNYAALTQVTHLDRVDMVYVTYHVDVGKTPFFIGVDYDKQKIVISIRGTLSMKDLMTDLNAESDILPLRPVNEEWKGHKGMVEAAEYIYKKLKSENLLERAFNWRREAGTDKFDLVCVGHSLGGGTATILALMLRQEYPNIKCFAYSPPGGLLSYKAMEASKELVTSVVVGKDLVPRIGLHQLESLRHDLIAALKKSQHPKWRTLSSSMLCCWDDATSVESPSSPSVAINIHPLDSSINLSCHQPLYPPGRIIHIVRHHPNNDRKKLGLKRRFGKPEPVYQAVWADNLDFDQVLISKCMIQDHMPDNVLEALEKATCTHAWHNVYTSRSMFGPAHNVEDVQSQPKIEHVDVHQLQP